jgi:glucose-1-phosphate thymidylyltransferase
MKGFKGIILSGGTGSRFYPVTKSISKQLLAIFNKPMIYYSLSILMMMGIRSILIIVRPDEKKLYQKLLKSGLSLGIKIDYAVQKKPGGIAQSLIIGKKFIGKNNIALILGDNFFYNDNLQSQLIKALKNNKEGATIFACKSKKPKDFGVIEFFKNNMVKKIVEKPINPKSNYVVTGLYLYDNQAIELSKSLKLSKRRELEITDLNNLYLNMNSLKVIKMKRVKWMDNGNCDDLLKCSNFVRKTEIRKKNLILSPEKIAFEKGWITKFQLINHFKNFKNSSYGIFLKRYLKSH